jgi:hypothetical protein
MPLEILYIVTLFDFQASSTMQKHYTLKYVLFVILWLIIICFRHNGAGGNVLKGTDRCQGIICD